ncbi:MAG TPA: hypothetical protein VF167_06135 [Longimicrobiaceae bacterium]
MGTKKRILKGAGYLAAPKLLFTLNHPRKAMMARAATWATGHLMPRRRRSHTMGTTAMRGLSAAAVALPVGLWLGRRIFHRDRQPQSA